MSEALLLKGMFLTSLIAIATILSFFIIFGSIILFCPMMCRYVKESMELTSMRTFFYLLLALVVILLVFEYGLIRKLGWVK
ncbi:MAG: hypothetical protein QXQ33_00660 [Nitrososphaerota archaeon]